MIIFHTNHIGLFNKLLVYRLNKGLDEPACLLYPNSLFINNVKLPQRLIKEGIFDFILPYDFQLKSDSTENAESSIKQGFDFVFNNYNVNISSATNVFTFSDEPDLFSIYCSINKAKFHVYEIAANQYSIDLTRRVLDFERNYRGNDILVKVREKYGCINYDSDLITKLQHPDTTISYAKNSIFMIFDYVSIKNSMSHVHRSLILSLFDCSQFVLNNNIRQVILLTNSSAVTLGLNISPYDEYLLYQYLIDFYAGKEPYECIIKPHPMSDISYNIARIHFPECVNISKSFPSDFLIYVDDFLPDCALSPMSTSLQSIGKNINILSPGMGYWKFYESLPQLWVSLQLAEVFGKNKIVQIGIDEHQFNYFLKHSFVGKLSESVKKSFDIVDDAINIVDFAGSGDVFMNDYAFITHDTVCIIIRASDDERLFTPVNSAILEDMIPINIKVKHLRDNSMVQPETIYVYSKNHDLLRRAESFSCFRKLKYAGAEIRVDCGNPTESKEWRLVKRIETLEREVSLLLDHKELY